MLQLPFLNRNSRQNDNKFLAINISSDYIKCVAFYIDENSLKVLAENMQKVPQGSVRTGVIVDKAAVMDALEVTLQTVFEKAGSNITNTIFGISAEVSIENVVTAKVNRGTRTEITPKEVKAIMQRLEEAAQEEAQKTYAETTGNLESTLETVTAATVYTKIDGTKVADLEGHKGQIIETACYNAFSQQYHLKTLQNIAKQLGLSISAISSNNFAISKLLEESQLEKNDYVLVEIGSDFTNIGVAFGGAIVANKGFPIGIKHFIEEISQIMGITYEEAEKLLQNHTERKLTKSESGIVQDCLEEVLEIWLRGLELTFQEFTGVKTFSPTVYIFGAGTQIPEVQEILNNEPWPKAIPFKAPPNVKPLSPKDFGKITSDNFLETIALGSIYEGLLQ